MVRGDSEPENVKRQAGMGSVQGRKEQHESVMYVQNSSDEDEKDSNMEGLTIWAKKSGISSSQAMENLLKVPDLHVSGVTV